MVVLKWVIMRSRSRCGRDATLVVVVVEAFVLKNLKTEVAHPNHAVLAESGRRDNVGGTSGTENLAYVARMSNSMSVSAKVLYVPQTRQ